MAVPASGILTMLGLARERKLGNYNSTGTLFYPILMTDLINGGGLNSFPALNVNSPSKPNTLTTHCIWAASGAYSDGTSWGIWDGKAGAWTQIGFCFQ